MVGDTLVVCNTLQHTATHYNTLQHTATRYTIPEEIYDVMRRDIQTHLLQHTASHCNTLQHTATHYTDIDTPPAAY